MPCAHPRQSGHNRADIVYQTWRSGRRYGTYVRCVSYPTYAQPDRVSYPQPFSHHGHRGRTPRVVSLLCPTLGVTDPALRLIRPRTTRPLLFAYARIRYRSRLLRARLVGTLWSISRGLGMEMPPHGFGDLTCMCQVRAASRCQVICIPKSLLRETCAVWNRVVSPSRRARRGSIVRHRRPAGRAIMQKAYCVLPCRTPRVACTHPEG